MKRALVLFLLTASVSVPGAQTDPAWRRRFDPLRIVGNIYYVGTRGVST
jgi:hypothetical protein